MTDAALRELARWLHQRHARATAFVAAPADQHPHTAKLPGDTMALRGIPMIGHGIGGTSPGTNPETAAVSTERHR